MSQKLLFRFDEINGVITLVTRGDRGSGLIITGKETFGACKVTVRQSITNGNYSNESSVTDATEEFTWRMAQGVPEQQFVQVEVTDADVVTNLQIGISGGFEIVGTPAGVPES